MRRPLAPGRTPADRRPRLVAHAPRKRTASAVVPAATASAAQQRPDGEDSGTGSEDFRGTVRLDLLDYTAGHRQHADVNGNPDADERCGHAVDRSVHAVDAGHLELGHGYA